MRTESILPLFGDTRIAGRDRGQDTMKRLMKKSGWVAVLLLVMTVGARAAEQQSKQAEITLELAASCVLSVDDIQGFGVWPTGERRSIDQVNLGSITVICDSGMAYAVGIDAGENYDGASRRLSDGTNYLPYVLRAHSSSGQEWGDTGLTGIIGDYVTTHPAQAVDVIGSGASQSITLWGDATVSAAVGGIYKDRVKIILVW